MKAEVPKAIEDHGLSESLKESDNHTLPNSMEDQHLNTSAIGGIQLEVDLGLIGGATNNIETTLGSRIFSRTYLLALMMSTHLSSLKLLHSMGRRLSRSKPTSEREMTMSKSLLRL